MPKFEYTKIIDKMQKQILISLAVSAIVAVVAIQLNNAKLVKDGRLPAKEPRG